MDELKLLTYVLKSYQSAQITLLNKTLKIMALGTSRQWNIT